MSMEAMAQVWPALIQPVGRKMVATIFADLCRNAEGTRIFPSLQTIALHASISRDQARRHVQALVTMGVLQVEARASQHRPTTYRLRYDVLQRLHGRHPCGNETREPEVASVPIQTLHRRRARRGVDAAPEVAPTPPYPKGSQRIPKEPSLLGDGSLAAPPAGAGGGKYPSIGEPADWMLLEQTRTPRQQHWQQWDAQARLHFPNGGPGLKAAIQVLVENPRLSNICPPARSKARARHDLDGMNYGKGL